MREWRAGMAEVKNGDCVSLSLQVEKDTAITFLGDFAGGRACVTFGSVGSDEKYQIVADSINSVKLTSLNGKSNFTLFVYRSPNPVTDKSGIQTHPDLPLTEGQILSLRAENGYGGYKLRLNYLSI